MHHHLQVFMSLRINTISPNTVWVHDTGCSSYIWIDMQGLRSNRKLTKESLTFESEIMQKLQLLLYGLMF